MMLNTSYVIRETPKTVPNKNLKPCRPHRPHKLKTAPHKTEPQNFSKPQRPQKQNLEIFKSPHADHQ